MAGPGKTIWVLTAVNVGAALITAMCLVYLKGMQSAQTRVGPNANHGVFSSKVVPNSAVGHGAHPVFDCSMVRKEITADDKDFENIDSLVQNREKYANRPVAVRAYVVHAYQNIMGTNWFQLCDRPNGGVLMASGSQWVEPGNEVVIRGILDVDRDIGNVYHFPIYIENAKLEGDNVRSDHQRSPTSVYDL